MWTEVSTVTAVTMAAAVLTVVAGACGWAVGVCVCVMSTGMWVPVAAGGSGVHSGGDGRNKVWSLAAAVARSGDVTVGDGGWWPSSSTSAVTAVTGKPLALLMTMVVRGPLGPAPRPR